MATDKKKNSNDDKAVFAFTSENFKLLIIGGGILIVGYLLMMGGGSEDPNVFNGEELFSFRRITLAPIVVLFGYLFIIYAIMKKPRAKS